MSRRLTPTLYDKLLADVDLDGSGEGGERDRRSSAYVRHFKAEELERFSESHLRISIRRELSWILNTSSLESSEDLSDFPNVRTSVVNYGVSGLGGIGSSRTSSMRERAVSQAVKAFEPRLDTRRLEVVSRPPEDGVHRAMYLIRGDITAASRAVEFTALTEPDTDAVTVRE